MGLRWVESRWFGRSEESGTCKEEEKGKRADENYLMEELLDGQQTEG